MPNSRDYWRRREAEAMRAKLKEEELYRKRLDVIYENVIHSCQNEINAFYARYAQTTGLTMDEAMKAVKYADIADLERKAERYVRERDFSALANSEMKLYNTTMKINRLEWLKSDLGIELVKGFSEAEGELASDLLERTMSEHERMAGILGKTVRLSRENAEAIVNASFRGATFSQRIWTYQAELKAHLDILLQQGLIRGVGSRELARDLVKTFGVERKKAELLMVTELARVETEAQKLSYIDGGFPDYMFMGGQAGACPICSGLDGKVFKVKDMMPGTNAPPMHPRCRCGTAAYMDRKVFSL